MRKAPSASRWWLLSLAVLAACEEGGGGVPGRLDELERMAFVPGGSIELSFLAPPDNRWVVPEPLLFDRFESTRADWSRLLGDPPGWERWRSPQARWTEETGTWPAYMSQREAIEYAGLRGMRLPSAHEWLFAAMGPASSKHPWGRRPQQSVANTLELGLRRPAPVGSFESGVSPFGLYDTVGNVWEWVSDRVPGYGEGPGAAPGSGGEVPLASAMGGGWLTRLHPLYEGRVDVAGSWIEYLAQTLHPDHRDPEVGVRCCVDAAEWLRAHAGELGAAPRARERLLVLGRRWGVEQSSAIGFLRALAEEQDAPPALTWLAAGAEDK